MICQLMSLRVSLGCLLRSHVVGIDYKVFKLGDVDRNKVLF